MPNPRISRLLWRIYDVAETFAQVGLASALLVGVVDYLGIVTGQYTGDRWLLAPYLLALELLVLAFVVALLALWVSASAWVSERAGARFARFVRGPRFVRSPRFEVWLRALLTCLPWAGLLAWIPSSWIAEHWAELRGVGRAVAVALYPAALLIALVGARALDSLFRGAPEERPRWLFRAVGAGALLLAAACYWMDRQLYVGLYEDFHYGLAALGVNAVFLALLAARASLLGPEARFGGWLGSRWTTGVSLVAALCTLTTLELVRPAIFGPSQSVVFAKLVHTLRSATDFDEDGVSSWMGGSDCAPFEARVTPGKFDLPGNDLDEDCSGTGATWPEPHRTGKYHVPKLRGKNLLLISIDALRADHLGVYGYARKTSPNIDALAAQSVRFSRAYSSSPKTMEVFPSVMSGLYPSNISRNYSDPALREFLKNKALAKGKKVPKVGGTIWYRVADNVELLAELLKEAGYSTHAVTAALPLDVFGLERGFDSVAKTKGLTQVGQRLLKDAARGDKPFFLWLHYNGPHEPYVKHAEFPFGDRPIDRYDSEIAKDDQQVGVLLRTLRELELEQDTIVVLTADHGEEFGDHGGQFHTLNLYRELLHVPLLLKLPGIRPRVVTAPVELVDLVPTFCEVLKLSKSCARYDGQSLIAAIEGKRDPGRGAYAEAYKGAGQLQRRSLFDGRFRLIEDFQHDRLELYDHDSDPNEQRDIANEQPEMVRQLMDRITTRAWFRQGQLFTKYHASNDPMVLAKGLNLLLDDELLDYALDQIERDLQPKYEKHLKRLSRRTDLSAGTKRRAKAMAAECRTASRQVNKGSAL
ncbi:MAG TPA: sulfatase, partial [Polyangiaceae bacterium]|nr:sulfatase [Polyangiaceae bacterium]